MNYDPVYHVPGWARKTGKGATVEVRAELSLWKCLFPLIPSAYPEITLLQYSGIIY